ncbi:MAG: amino acid ABC transporter substrate-binding protein [Patulibacter sp.]|nr:amino acid ABC transporter substrate-binding protein [Patulibacter sp.]
MPRPPHARRRSAIVVAVVLIAAALAGCGDDEAPASAGTFSPTTPATLSVAVDEVPRPGFWLGTPTAPTGGFEHGLARALATRLGLDRLRIVIVPFERIVRGDLGGADVAISDVSATDGRRRHVDFSAPYLPAVPAVLTTAGREVRDVHGARELRWAVQGGTTLASALDRRIRPEHDVAVRATEDAVIAELTSGAVEAVMLDLPVALAYARASNGRLEVAAQLPGDEHLAVVLPKGSGNRIAVDSALRALDANGTMRELAERWLGTDFQNGQVDDVVALRTTG